MKNAIYIDPAQQEMAVFAESLMSTNAKKSDNVFDSVSVSEVSKSVIEAGNLPTAVSELIEKMNDEHKHRVLDAVVQGVSLYREAHGEMPTGDVILSAVKQATSVAGKEIEGHVLDSVASVGGSAHHDAIAAQPNRVIVSIVSGIAEAIPFASNLPFDIGSNQSKLAILTHSAGSAFGAYAAGGSMDGVNLGKEYLSSEREAELTLNEARTTASGRIAGVIGGSANNPLLRGRTTIQVNGLDVAGVMVSQGSSSATESIVGTIGASTVTGTVTIATGEVALAFNPALPANTKVVAQGYIDFEVAPELTPSIKSDVVVFNVHANPWRGLVSVSRDAQTQYGNEIGANLISEGLMTARSQLMAERHFLGLKKLTKIAAANQFTYDLDWAAQKADKTRAEVLQDFFAVLSAASQDCAERTHEFGLEFLYVDKYFLGQIRSMPDTMFKPSGIKDRAGIFFAGTLYGTFKVYYNPKATYDKNESDGTSTILAIGRSTQVGRNPLIIGDAVPPTIIDISTNKDMNHNRGMYARNFTNVNPYLPSALGCALIKVIGQEMVK